MRHLATKTQRGGLRFVATLVAALLLGAMVGGAPAEQPSARVLPEPAWVSHAGGAVQLALPGDWNVGEWTVGRSLRLVATPGEVPSSGDSLDDGVWLRFQRFPLADATPAAELLRLLPLRLAAAAPAGRRRQALRPRTLDGHPALQGDFLAPAAGGHPALRGYHLLARVGGGLLELHFVAPLADFESRAARVEELLGSLRLAPPRPAPTAAELAPQVADAAPLVGAWRSVSARLVLGKGGRMRLDIDGQGGYALDAEGRYDYARKVRQLAGSFTADGDLLRVTWDDGSRLNYRWRADGDRLFLTDHHGRVSQLERLW